MRAFLKDFGALDADLVYRGSQRAGYRELPGAGNDAGQITNHSTSTNSSPPAFGVSPQRLARGRSGYDGATGGWHVEDCRSHRALGSKRRDLQRGSDAAATQRNGGRAWNGRDLQSGKATAIDADHVLVTIQPGLVPYLDHDFSPRVKQALAAPESSPLAKVGFQATHRFWELDQQIYGGISWTDHSITQIWYPSQGIHAQKGLLVGAYVFRDGEDFAKLSPAARVELALQGGEALHPQYRRYLEKGVAISWRKVKYSHGATTHWSDEARKTEYPVLLKPDGPYLFAGEYLSYINGWQEGALRSAYFAIEQLAALRSNKPSSQVKGKSK